MVNKDILGVRDALRGHIKEALQPIIEGDCCLLDVPQHRNMGDHLIWAGEETFVRMHPRAALSYVAPRISFDFRRVGKGDLILLQGGGNFGDLYRESQVFKERVVARFRSNRIVLMPQSVCFTHRAALQRCVEVFSEHPDLTLCARDHASEAFLREHFRRQRVVLVPDLAFCGEFAQERSASSKGREALFLCRRDKEQSPAVPEMSGSDHVDVHDWPSFRVAPAARVAGGLRRTCEQHFPVLLALCVNPLARACGYGSRLKAMREQLIKEGLSFLASYELIISNRLHGQIAAVSLGVPSVLLDNAYGKNRAFHETWLQGCPGISFADSRDALCRMVAENLPACLAVPVGRQV